MLTHLKELQLAAEHLRHDEVKKSVLNNLVWEKTLQWIKDTPHAQTKDVPVNTKKFTGESGPTTKKWMNWERGPLRLAIQREFGIDDDIEIEAHYVVETKLIPLFLDGFPVDTVHEAFVPDWNHNVQDCSYALFMLEMQHSCCVVEVVHSTPLAFAYWLQACANALALMYHAIRALCAGGALYVYGVLQ